MGSKPAVEIIDAAWPATYSPVTSGFVPPVGDFRCDIYSSEVLTTMRHPLSLRAPGLGLVLLMLALLAPLTVEAKDNWLRVQTKNFTLVGNASEKDMRQV